MELTHDRLQAECFAWLWNYHPETRGCCFAAMNEIKKLPCETRKAHMIRVNQAKSLGLLPGVYDLLFYWRGVLYGFDIKVGKDRLSKEQINFSWACTAQGGKFYTVENFDRFVQLINEILTHG